MFADTLTLKDLAGADRTFKLIVQDGSGTVRIDTATTAAEPCKMSIKHNVQGSGPSAVDRHLVQIARTALNATTGKAVTSIVNLTVSVPRDTAITAAEVEDDLVAVLRFVANTVFDPTADYTSVTFDGLVIGES